MSVALESAPSAFPALPKNQAHVWRYDLDSVSLSDYFTSESENERAARFHFARDRNRFLAGRGILRSLLAQYLNVPAAQPEFIFNAHGKPELHDNPNSLRFNISHSHNQALFAFCFDCDIGVDIEFRRLDSDGEKISRLATRFFTVNESQSLDKLNPTEQHAAFFRLWTRKEAVLKAIGTGVSGGLSRFEISLLPGEKAQVLAPCDEAKHWSLFDLNVAPEYSGSLAVRTEITSGFSVRCWDYPPFDFEAKVV